MRKMLSEYNKKLIVEPLNEDKVLKAKEEIERNHPIYNTKLQIAFPYLIGKVYFFLYGLKYGKRKSAQKRKTIINEDDF